MMKTKRIACGGIAASAVVCCLASNTLAGGFVNDDFESYAVGTSLTGLVARGWGASDSGVVVTNNVFNNPTNMAALPPSVVASNDIGGQTGKIWTDCLVDEAIRLDPSNLPPVNPAVSLMVGVTTDGFAVVYNPASNGWDICTRDAGGGNLAGVASGAWVRVSLCQDYGEKVSALFMNGRLLRQQIPFVGNPASYGTFRLRSGASGSAFLDNVYVSNAVPPTLSGLPVSSSNDLDGDGVLDVWEIQSYGNLVVWGSPVISNSIAFGIPDVTLNNLTVTNGAVLTLSASGLNITGTVQVAGASAIVLSNGVVGVSNLIISSNAFVQVVNGTLVANGQTFSGTFTLDAGWSGVLIPASLNYTNDFEAYPLGLALVQCGGQGWGASSSGSVIQSNMAVHGQSALVSPVSSLSNVVDVTASALSNVWTDVNIYDTAPRYAGLAYPPVNTNRAVMLFVNTNNHVVIWNSNAWDECSLDIAGNSAATIATGRWVRITVFEDFGAKKAALFVDGQLLRQQIPFIASTVGSYGLLNLNAGNGVAYLDNVSILTNLPAGLTNLPLSDLDHDGIADAVEVSQYGSTLMLPRGSVFKIR